jgi:hypothetical protein
VYPLAFGACLLAPIALGSQRASTGRALVGSVA